MKMSDSTSELQLRRSLSISDVLQKATNLYEKEYSTWNLVQAAERLPDAWGAAGVTEQYKIAECQHAKNRELLRRLGRTEPNATAAPEARLRSNEYPEARESRLDSRIREFLSYSDDWDGDGAGEIPLRAIYESLNFLDEFRRRFPGNEPRSAAPSPDGEIAVYWHKPTGYAELNFDGTGRISMCWGYDTDEIELIEEELESIGEADSSTIWETLSEFLGQNRRQQQGS